MLVMKNYRAMNAPDEWTLPVHMVNDIDWAEVDGVVMFTFDKEKNCRFYMIGVSNKDIETINASIQDISPTRVEH